MGRLIKFIVAGAALLAAVQVLTVPAAQAAAPVVSSVDPVSGPAAGGNYVNVYGSNFEGATSVTFGGVEMTPFSVTEGGFIEGFVPAHAAGSVSVAVTTPGGTHSLSNAYTFVEGPPVTSVYPNRDYTTGGAQVTIIGSGFDNVLAVKFGGVDATSFFVNSSTKIFAQAPPHAAGTIDVVVATQSASSAPGEASKFTYLAAPAITTLYQFKGGNKDGANPSGWLIADKAGNLYGVASSGGAANAGAVFMLAANTWKRTILHMFGSMPDGDTPIAGLTMDDSGKLYGTTSRGGAQDFGTVFRLTPPASSGGKWSYQQLYSFKNKDDGTRPQSLVIDDDGAVYGSTEDGGTQRSRTLNKVRAGGGTLFKLTPGTKTPWVKTTLHEFSGADGYYPSGRLRIDADGVLTGTTEQGGKKNGGTVFTFAPPAGSKAAAPKLLYSFNTNAAYQPMLGGLAIGKNGEIFGTTLTDNNDSGVGAIFMLSPTTPGGSKFTQSVIFSFNGDYGALPYYGVALGKKGALFGATSGGGPNDGGIVFKLLPPASGQTAWTPLTVHSFAFDDPAGFTPMSDLLVGKGNAIYGLTQVGGGPCGCGAVFMIKE